MNYLSIIQNTRSSTSLVSPVDEKTLYTVTSLRGSDGSWTDVVYRVERDADVDAGGKSASESDPSEIRGTRTELARVFYIDAGTTRVRFTRGPSEAGQEGDELELDAFLRRSKAYSNSRIFVGVDGMVYKWRINGERLELFNTATHTLIARSHPRPGPKFSLPLSLPGLKSLTTHSPTIPTPPSKPGPRPGLVPGSPHPTGTLALHPALLDPDSRTDSLQLLDATVLTFLIMQRLLRERLRFRYP